MINIKFSWEGEKKLNDLMKYIEKMPALIVLESAISTILDQAVTDMRDSIDIQRSRPDKGTHHLENAIDWEAPAALNRPEIGRVTFLLGDIAKMTKEAPYWEMLDQGGWVPPPSYGFFGEGEAPAFGKSGQLWTEASSPGKWWPLDPTKEVEARNYIAPALIKVRQSLDLVVNTFGEQLIKKLASISK